VQGWQLGEYAHGGRDGEGCGGMGGICVGGHGWRHLQENGRLR
jgi:hypothetical protein